jgi:CubicO group peptidase (beta-lactamase class C family)
MAPETSDHQPGADRANWRAAPYSRWAFHHVSEIMPTTRIENAPDDVSALAEAPTGLDDFRLAAPGGSALDLAGFLKLTETDALVIVRDGRILFEAYDNGTTAATPHILMSGTKAMVGLLAGMLGHSAELDPNALVSDHVPEIGGTAYAGATVRHLLDMRTGVMLTAEQSSAYDAALTGAPAAPGGAKPSLHGVLATLTGAQSAHGRPFTYISQNTDLLGWTIERATGQPLAELISERLWKPMGAEHAAQIIVDDAGSPWCSGGLNVTARDFARVGQLLIDDGRRGSAAILPKALVDDLCHGGDREAWRTGEWGAAFAQVGQTMSYRNGWYSVHDEPEILFAMGTHGQNLFIDRASRLVIAKLSSQAYRLNPQLIGLTHMAFPEFKRCLGL